MKHTKIKEANEDEKIFRERLVLTASFQNVKIQFNFFRVNNLESDKKVPSRKE